MQTISLKVFKKIQLINRLFRISKKHFFLNKIANYLFQKKTDLIVNELQKFHAKTLESFKEKTSFENSTNITNIIWVCWFQGEDHAPSLVQKCIKNLKQFNENEYVIKIVTLENYQEFIELPPYIEEKFNKGIISYTQLSDILRFTLLATHGGMWIDSTYLTLSPLPKYITTHSFFTLTSSVFPNYSISKGRWAGNFIKFGRNDLNAQLFKELFFEYWKTNNQLIDYFLIDYYFELIYRNIKPFRKELENLPQFGNNRHLLNKILFKQKNEMDNMKLAQDTYKIYKLTYKFKIEKVNKKNTYFREYF
ncbi:capsular polysaccharide synthesis protein [Acinetobacter schindleri]|uniref:capsular polysaccharide synthesis protein n=1 Tax=Acinetobacter schindleri TaxID=108981 RepID=UPI002360C117|nr:capsular polysaccharide synthesis protein [Acinetobacter schindleri]WDE15547.1 capsular polysaccharide synthesis protein [Acinetobacter schindleri]